MGWYDLFSHLYDRSLEPLYREARARAADALRLAPGLTVLDVPTGTGQSLPALAPPVLPGGCVVGVDGSAGMLARARARAEAEGFAHVRLAQADVHAVDEALLAGLAGASRAGAKAGGAAGAGQVDRLHIFLGLSAFPRWEDAFATLWARLAPGGRCVVVDVHADPLGLQGRMVNLVARADIRRETWAALQSVGVNYTKIDLPSKREHGGQLFLAAADKAGGDLDLPPMPRQRVATDPFRTLEALVERLGATFEGLGLAELASAEGWSHGEISKTWVVNARTAKPERGGLRCARTFGPVVDDECICTKYRGAQHRGVQCEKCGVSVGPASLRSERFGHVALAAPVPHPWFREYAAAALGLGPEAFDRVVGGEAGLVTAVHDMRARVAPGEVVSAAHLASISDELGEAALEVLAGPEAAARRVAEGGFCPPVGASLGGARDEIVEQAAAKLAALGVAPRSLFLDVLPVLPPGLRERRRAYEYEEYGIEAFLATSGRGPAAEPTPEAVERARRFEQPSGLDALYAEIVRRNGRLAEFRSYGRVPAIVLHAEWRALRDAVTALMGPSELGAARRSGQRLVDLLAARLESIDSAAELATDGAFERLLFALGLRAPGAGGRG